MARFNKLIENFTSIKVSGMVTTQRHRSETAKLAMKTFLVTQNCHLNLCFQTLHCIYPLLKKIKIVKHEVMPLVYVGQKYLHFSPNIRKEDKSFLRSVHFIPFTFPNFGSGCFQKVSSDRKVAAEEDNVNKDRTRDGGSFT